MTPTERRQPRLGRQVQQRLMKLHLVDRRDDEIVPLPALARFHLGDPAVRSRGTRPDEPGQLFAETELELTS